MSSRPYYGTDRVCSHVESLSPKFVTAAPVSVPSIKAWLVDFACLSVHSWHLPVSQSNP